MSALIDTKPATWMSANKWTVWRLLNSAVFFFSLFAPWVVLADHPGGTFVFTGLDILLWYRRFALLFGTSLATSFLVRYSLGLTVALMYAAFNTIAAFFPRGLTDRRSWKVFAVCSLALGCVTLWNILGPIISDWQSLQRALWGCWLFVMAVASSLLAEIWYSVPKSESR
jgi:hypothetical protein